MTESYLDILTETIRNNWDQPALTDFYLSEDGTAQDTSRGNHYTYGEMYVEIVRVADLLTNLGLQKGDHIAICGANSAHWVIAYLAIAKTQGVSVTVMHSLQSDQIAQMVDFSDARALFINKELWAELQGQSLPQVQNVIALEGWEILRGEKVEIPNRKSLIDNQECGFPHSGPDSLAMICFTSGTTNKLKGVMLPHRSLNNNVFNLIERYLDCSNNNYIIFMPLAHMAAFVAEMWPQMLRGKHIYIYNGNQTVESICISIKVVQPYMMTEVPQIITTIGKQYGYSCLQDLKQLLVGCAVLDRVEERKMLDLNIPLILGYGQTEVGAAISMPNGDAHKESSVGRILSNIDVKIVHGEILVKGENVMLGYYKDPEATAKKIDSDGWLHTGDKGHLDEDGYLYVEGRLEQDIIVLPNGENIRPDNIESLINALPEVSESIVLARDGKLVAIVVPARSSSSSISNASIVSSVSSLSSVSSASSSSSPSSPSALRHTILRTINPQLPLFSQLYDVEITDKPLARTDKQTLKRYLYN